MSLHPFFFFLEASIPRKQNVTRPLFVAGKRHPGVDHKLKRSALRKPKISGRIRVGRESCGAASQRPDSSLKA
jgi:hypothetical protein